MIRRVEGSGCEPGESECESRHTPCWLNEKAGWTPEPLKSALAAVGVLDGVGVALEWGADGTSARIVSH
jgi:hypothetical protein